MMVIALVRKKREESGPTDRKEGDTDKRLRSHEPPDDQPS